MDLQNSNLNRSFSEPDINSDSPYFRRILVEEIYRRQYNSESKIRYRSQLIENGNRILFQTNWEVSDCRSRCFSEKNLEKKSDRNVLTQSYSDKNLSDCRNTFSAFLSFRNSSIDSNIYKGNQNFEDSRRQEMPMDVDDCYESQNDKINDWTPCPRETKFCNPSNQTKVRKLNHEPLIPKPKYKLNILIIFSVIVLLLASCSFIYNVPSLHFDLDKVLYQDHVKEITLKNLNSLHEDMKFKKVLVFVGSTGVGKTYIVNLIRKQFPVKYIVDINFLLNTHLNTDNIIASLRSDGCYFITIDDLKINNLEDVISFINQLPEKCMLIVPIFNIHDVDNNLKYTVNYDHFKKIEQDFMEKYRSNSDIVLFNTINRDNLEIWLRDQINEKGIMREEETIISLLNEHEVDIYGFKGLLTKINLVDL